MIVELGPFYQKPFLVTKENHNLYQWRMAAGRQIKKQTVLSSSPAILE